MAKERKSKSLRTNTGSKGGYVRERKKADIYGLGKSYVIRVRKMLKLHERSGVSRAVSGIMRGKDRERRER